MSYARRSLLLLLLLAPLLSVGRPAAAEELVLPAPLRVTPIPPAAPDRQLVPIEPSDLSQPLPQPLARPRAHQHRPPLVEPRRQSSSSPAVTLAHPTSAEEITERYPNRKVKIQRSVVLDEDRNYVNHGQWKMWDPQGRLVAHGSYRNGQRDGTWLQLLGFFTAAGEGFQPPFISQAEFVEGQLHGTWTVSDSRQRVVGSWPFERGQLHGQVQTWHPNGQPQQETTYDRGRLDGEATAWTAQGKIARREFFADGRQRVPVVTRYDRHQKQTEGWLEYPAMTLNVNVDWWQGVLEITREAGKGDPVRIGKWTEWHANGVTRFRGSYQRGKPAGSHTWWHENGQKLLTGEFETGQRDGLWTRWHANGNRHEEGTYLAGVKQGVWKAWDAEGQLAEVQHLGGGEQVADVPLDEAELIPLQSVSLEPVK